MAVNIYNVRPKVLNKIQDMVGKRTLMAAGGGALGGLGGLVLGAMAGADEPGELRMSTGAGMAGGSLLGAYLGKKYAESKLKDTTGLSADDKNKMNKIVRSPNPLEVFPSALGGATLGTGLGFKIADENDLGDVSGTAAILGGMLAGSIGGGLLHSKIVRSIKKR